MRLILCPFATGWFSDLWVLQNHQTQRGAVAPTQLPTLESGDWRGEIAGSCSVNFGQTVQTGRTPQLVEFTYIVVPALLTMPEDRFSWPAVVMIMVPTQRNKVRDDVGFLFKAPNRLSLSLGLDVTPSQLSDLIPMLDAKGV